MVEEASILRTIKKLIGGDVDSEEFDIDIMVAINSAISTLYQLGLETKDPFTGSNITVSGETDTWYDLFGDLKFIDMVKTYVYQKVRLIFDPPQNSFLVSSIQDQLKELEWRINVAIESDNSTKQTD